MFSFLVSTNSFRDLVSPPSKIQWDSFRSNAGCVKSMNYCSVITWRNSTRTFKNTLQGAASCDTRESLWNSWWNPSKYSVAFYVTLDETNGCDNRKPDILEKDCKTGIYRVSAQTDVFVLFLHPDLPCFSIIKRLFITFASASFVPVQFRF